MSRHSRAEAPSVPISTRLSPAERDRVDQAATANHQSVSQFARDAFDTAAAECLEAGDRASSPPRRSVARTPRNRAQNTRAGGGGRTRHS
jgi:hypothetical protein